MHCFITLHFITFQCQGFFLPENNIYKLFATLPRITDHFQGQPWLTCVVMEKSIFDMLQRMQVNSRMICIALFKHLRMKKSFICAIIPDLDINGRVRLQIEFDEYGSRFTLIAYIMRLIWRLKKEKKPVYSEISRSKSWFVNFHLIHEKKRICLSLRELNNWNTVALSTCILLFFNV